MWMRKFVWKITRVTNKTSQICQYRVCPPVASMQATLRRRILLMSLAICNWGILLHSSCKAAPKAWSVLGRKLSVVHAGRECPKHARLATSQGIEQANRDDPHCSAAGTAVLSSPDEVLRCILHPAALRGTIRLPPPYRSCSTMAQFAVKSIPHGLNRHSYSSSWETFAQLFGAYCNKSVCSNRAESTSQRWT